MPRDLQQERDASSGEDADVEELAELQPDWRMSGTRDGEDDHGPTDATSIMARLLENQFMEREVPDDVPDALKSIYPYATTLNLRDIDSCIALEEAAFPAELRASKDKIVYRLTRCGECCFGVFTSAKQSEARTSDSLTAPTASTAHAPDSFSPDRRGVLLAYVLATKSVNATIEDSDMAVPEDWQTNKSTFQNRGHQDHGRTIMIHSLAVVPQFQKRSLGSMLMKAYVQRIMGADIADSIALLAEEKMVSFYEKLGFESMGKSKATHGGVCWIDMVLDLAKIKGDMESDED